MSVHIAWIAVMGTTHIVIQPMSILITVNIGGTVKVSSIPLQHIITINAVSTICK